MVHARQDGVSGNGDKLVSVLRLAACRGLWVALAATLLVSLAVEPADAARKRVRKKSPTETSRQQPKSDDDGLGGGRYAAYVIDDNTGKVLFARNADAPRHPASLTKMLTLYILFEDLERGRVSLDTQMPVSAKAADQDPTKLGLRPGQTLAVEDAIKSLVTLSANDASMVIAEFLGGSQDGFADRMNATARRIGMTGSRFYNPNGLPDSRQITTAKDMVVLGSALAERFPTYYRYFQTRSFSYKGRVIGNHNRLLGRVEGVDGIKTGYTRASGFNLVSSLRRDGKHLVAAVMGGPTGAARDRHMESLLETYLSQAQGGGKSVSVASVGGKGDVAAAPRKTSAAVAPIKIAADAEPPVKPSVERGAAVAMARAILQPGDAPAQPLDLVPQATPSAKPQMVALASVPVLPPVPDAGQPAPAAVQAAAVAPVPASRAVVFGAPSEALPPKNTQRLPMADTPRVTSLAHATISSKEVADLVETASLGAPKKPDRIVAAAAPMAPERPVERPSAQSRAAEAALPTGWVIQIAAVDSEAAARSVIAKAQDKAGAVLKGRAPFTENATKGSSSIVRARFGGFPDQNAASAACSALKKKDITCLALKR
jgi:D-alanyl-D-alanine carboxypeptidase